MIKMILDVLIVGGGLSGMALAQRLSNRKTSSSKLRWKLLEARIVLGGRLANDATLNQIDLGGAWMWPEHQPKMGRLVTALGVETFRQPDDPSSTRFVGGAFQLIRKLAAQVPSENIQISAPVLKCSLKATVERQGPCSDTTASEETSYVEVTTAAQETFRARRVVFCVPPRLITQHIAFDPPLSNAKWKAMQASHTWMAGVTKVALVYPKRFWDLSQSNMGLPSGGGSGPAFQMYDASTCDDGVSSLTFFTLVPPTFSLDDQALAKRVALQLGSVWTALGRNEMAQQVHSYSGYHVKRWPEEVYISEDPKPISIHPHPHPVRLLAAQEWNGMLLFAGSEADQLSPGVMEGAIGSAERVWEEIEPFLE